MAFADIKNNFIKMEAKLQPVVKDALGQLLQKEVTLSGETKAIADVKQALQDENFPIVAFYFISGPQENSRRHLFKMEPAFLARFYAWMIADEPAEQVGEEQFEGLKEAFQQIFGQIKLAVEDDQASFAVSDPQVTLLQNAERLEEFIEDKQALHSAYQVAVDDTSARVDYYYWAPSDIQDQDMPQVKDTQQVTIQPAEFDNLGGSGMETEAPRNVDMLMDVDLEIVVELDRKNMLVSELLKLGKGSIIELEKSAGEPLDILINGRKFAEGEVVVIDDKFGIRITQLLSPRDRIKSLG